MSDVAIEIISIVSRIDDTHILDFILKMLVSLENKYGNGIYKSN